MHAGNLSLVTLQIANSESHCVKLCFGLLLCGTVSVTSDKPWPFILQLPSADRTPSASFPAVRHIYNCPLQVCAEDWHATSCSEHKLGLGRMSKHAESLWKQTFFTKPSDLQWVWKVGSKTCPQEELKTCHRLLYGDGGRISPSLSLPQPEGFHLVVDPGPPLKFGSNMVRHWIESNSSQIHSVV